jgi:hypothetical protein
MSAQERYRVRELASPTRVFFRKWFQQEVRHLPTFGENIRLSLPKMTTYLRRWKLAASLLFLFNVRFVQLIRRISVFISAPAPQWNWRTLRSATN